MKSKKGAEFTIGTLIAIVLGVLVLAFLVYGFATGWTNFWEKIKGTAGTVNVDTLKQACLYACTTQQSYEYCCINRTIITETGSSKGRCQDTNSLIYTACDKISCTSAICVTATPATSPAAS